MKTYFDYVEDACKALDGWSGNAKSLASPTQLQTINLALLMAITDLIKTLESPP